MAVGTYRIIVRDKDFNRVGEVSTFEKLEIAKRFNAPGTWRIEFAKTAPIDGQGNVQTIGGYRGHVLASAPRTYWRMGESTGTSLIDESGNAYAAALNGGYMLGQPGALTVDPNGLTNTAVLFDGSTGYGVTSKPLGLGATDPFSFECWFKLTSLASATGHWNDLISTATAKAMMGVSTGNGLWFGQNGGGGFGIGGGSVSAGTWYYGVATFDGAFLRLYLQGSLVAGPTAFAGFAGTHGVVAVGRDITFGEQFGGVIDEAAVTPSVLSAATIAARYAMASNQLLSGNTVVAGTPDTDVATLLGQTGAGIIIERNGTVLMSGPVRKLERVWSETQDNLVAWGPDDLAVLADRIILPTPSGPPYTDYDVRTGVAETIIRQYVDVNAGPSAKTDRRVPGLSLAVDSGRGATVTGRGRYQQLLELIRQLAYDGGDLGFDVVQSGTARQFLVYTPTDKSAYVVFSRELDNLSGYEYSLSSAEANYEYVGGQGTGAARTIVEGQDSTSVARWGRIESFLDRRDTNVTAELNQAISDELGARQQKTELKLSPIDTDAIAFMRDYQLGDRVTVVVDGVSYVDLVRQVNLTLTADQSEQVAPTVGSSNLSKVVPTFFGGNSTQRSLDVRVSNLERA